MFYEKIKLEILPEIKNEKLFILSFN